MYKEYRRRLTTTFIVTTCMSNYQGNEILKRLGAKTGSLSAKCKRILGFSSNRRLEEGQTTYELDLQVEWVEGSLIDKINKLIDSESKSKTKENEIIDNQVDVKIITRAMRDRMATLQETVDSIAEKLDMNLKSDTKSKKAKAQAAQDSEADDALFHRNLLAVEEVVNDKFDDMKSQIKLVERQGKLVESKVASIEDKVELMESKVDRMEKTMEEMKEMLSQFITRGAADA